MTTRRRYNVCAAKQYESAGGTKTKWIAVGVAFETAKGIKLRLDAMPLQFDGELMLFPAEDAAAGRDRDGRGPREAAHPQALDEDVPF